MPEAFALLFVFVVVVAAWIGAWTQTRQPARDHAPEEIARLHHQATWLQQRLAMAHRENWDETMVATISDELGSTRRQLARSNSRAE